MMERDWHLLSAARIPSCNVPNSASLPSCCMEVPMGPQMHESTDAYMTRISSLANQRAFELWYTARDELWFEDSEAVRMYRFWAWIADETDYRWEHR